MIKRSFFLRHLLDRPGECTMRNSVRQAAEELIRRAKANGHVGAPISREEMNQLVSDTMGRIPRWLAELLVSLPLSGLEIGLQASEPDGEDDGVIWLEIPDARNLRSESLECYPGCAILERGYINIASSGGSGDPYFIAADDGDDPPVCQVYHDISDDADKILAEGRCLVAESFSEFLGTVFIKPIAP